ncbi:molybdenum cofactor guanylyltransferase [Haloarcula salina]|uniref:Probable molybdenum cofactor guanylyltransferase n=1 Tax=Haloarcula salina TaxID=1429914 RepID=A0AA41G876_9EURY|nr:molybdenum cofactor guanylyltransferase [Haloarcula salina]MBV0901957.1 molybdenum cofactor guanylyltransferase [Haloarcula salina]
MRTGVVVAGGRSTRFGGRDKAVADLAGTPMIRRVADRLDSAVDGLVVNCRAEQVTSITAALDGLDGVTFATDERPDEGPVAGVAAGLAAVESEYAAVVACDMPLVDPAFVTYLFERARGRDGAVPRPDEWLQPAQAVYRTEPMLAACRGALERGERRLRDAVAELDCAVVQREAIRRHGALPSLENVNTPAELDAVAEQL